MKRFFFVFAAVLTVGLMFSARAMAGPFPDHAYAGNIDGAAGNAIFFSDDDNDGTPNFMDLCQNTPAGAVVNDRGCPDTDGDGAYDNADLCPGTPAGTEVYATGCPKLGVVVGIDDSQIHIPGYVFDPSATPPDPTTVDSDGDGIVDANDVCPDQPADTADGCPVASSDGDGTISGSTVPIDTTDPSGADSTVSDINGQGGCSLLQDTGFNLNGIISSLVFAFSLVPIVLSRPRKSK